MLDINASCLADAGPHRLLHLLNQQLGESEMAKVIHCMVNKNVSTGKVKAQQALRFRSTPLAPPICCSSPWAVRPKGVIMMPAFRIRRSRRGSVWLMSSAHACTLVRSARSSCLTITAPCTHSSLMLLAIMQKLAPESVKSQMWWIQQPAEPPSPLSTTSEHLRLSLLKACIT